MTFNGQTYTNPKGSKRAFLFKLSNLGKVVWVHVFTGGPILSVGGVVLDTAGNVHVAGSFKGTLGHGSKTLTATGRDAYLAKLDSAGKALWVSQVTGPGDCHAYRLAMDAAGPTRIRCRSRLNSFVPGLGNGRPQGAAPTSTPPPVCRRS